MNVGKGYRCSLCGRKSPALLRHEDPSGRHKGTFTLIYCRSCRIGITHPEVDTSLDYDSDFYLAKDKGSLLSFLYQRFYRDRLAFIRQIHDGEGHLLDYGAGDGTFCSYLKTHSNYRISAYDPSIDAFSKIDRRNLPFFSKNHRERCDLICLWQVLEHVERPGDLLLQLNELLSEKGRIVISVPNLKGFQARYFGADWFHLDMPRHRFHFTRPGLFRLIEQAGLVVTAEKKFLPEYDLSGVLQSLLNQEEVVPNKLYEVLKNNRNHRGKSGRYYASLIGKAPRLAFMSGLISLCERIAGLGATITVAVRKK